MTTIRRIVVSQIDGNGADVSDSNELRPYGETAFYIDNNNKLTLSIFDGTRTHRKSKVLAPGVLWGSNADSGDGNSYDTIKLIPDAELYANSSHQYIIVDPTAGVPGHIHLRAGGPQDASAADLYLGGEQTFVRVSDTYDNVAIGTTGTNANFWVFGSDGTLTLPNGSSIESSAGNGIGLTTDRGTILFGNSPEIGGPSHFHIMKPESTTGVDLYFGDDHNFVLQRGTAWGQDPAYGVEIGASDRNGGGQQRWRFGTDGLITLPSNNTTIGSFFGSDAILCSTGTAFGIVSQGAGSSILQWLDDIAAPTSVAGIAANSLYSNTGSVQIFTGAVGSPPQYAWTFVNDGNLTFPRDVAGNSDPYLTISGGSTPTIQSTDVSLAGPADLAISAWNLNVSGSNGYRIVLNSDTGGIAADADMVLTSNYMNTGSTYSWTFKTSGELVFPDGTEQTTAYTGTNNATTIDITNTNGLTTVYYPTFVENRDGEEILRADVNLTYRTDDNILGVGSIGFSGGNFRVVNVPTYSTGASGDKEGDIAFSSSYIYYCFADFGSAPTETFTVVNVGENNNVITVNKASNPNYTVPTAGWYVVIGGVTMTLTAFSGNNPNGTDWNFIFDNPSGPLPSTVTLISNTGYTNIWKRLAWSGDTW